MVMIVTALVVLGVSGVSASAYVHSRGADCARTPQQQPPDAVGVSLDRIKQYLAVKYAGSVQDIVPRPDGADAVEMKISTHLGKVRVVRAARGGGWLIATTNTCGD
jgi:hypothetical protein